MERTACRALILLVLLSTVAIAQDFKGYRTTTLDSVIDEWSRKTKDEGPGYSFSRPEKIKFVAAMNRLPAPCDNRTLGTVMKMMGFADMLNQVGVSQCIGVTTSGGWTVFAYIQDVLAPGLKTDVRIGQSMVIYADFLAYQVATDRSRNMPIMLVNRFEPK
jgi:hypothetical protein